MYGIKYFNKIQQRIHHRRGRQVLSRMSDEISWEKLEKTWAEMLTVLHHAEKLNKQAISEKRSFHEIDPHWEAYLERFRHILKVPQRLDFLEDNEITRTMNRGGWGMMEKLSLPTVLEGLQKGFFGEKHNIETSVGRSRLDSLSPPLTSSTLFHALTAIRIHNDLGVDRFNHVVELGGGYGNFCRLMMTHNPTTSYLIIDFPEMLALAWLFLKLTLPKLPLVLLTDSTSRRPGTVTLVPIGCAFDLKVEGKLTLFTSHFALNESGSRTINGVGERRFFGAANAWILTAKKTWGSDDPYNQIKDRLDHIYKNVLDLSISYPNGVVLAADNN